MKPASTIYSWKDWPADVVQILRDWNHASSQRLRFDGKARKSFTCCDCGEECAAHRSTDATLDGNLICDGCLIARARHESLVLTPDPMPYVQLRGGAK